MSRRHYYTGVAEEIIKDIKAGKYKNKSSIYGLLMEIINDLPNTTVAKEA